MLRDGAHTDNSELLLTEAAPEPETKQACWQLIGHSELLPESSSKTGFAETCAALDSYRL